MNIGHLSVCDKSNQRVFGNKVDALLEGVLKFGELIRSDSGVDHQQEDRLAEFRFRLRQDVLNCGKVLDQLCGQLLFGDIICIVLRECVLILTRAT